MIEGYPLISAWEPRFIRFVADPGLACMVRLLSPPNWQVRIGFAAIHDDLIADC